MLQLNSISETFRSNNPRLKLSSTVLIRQAVRWPSVPSVIYESMTLSFYTCIGSSPTTVLLVRSSDLSFSFDSSHISEFWWGFFLNKNKNKKKIYQRSSLLNLKKISTTTVGIRGAERFASSFHNSTAGCILLQHCGKSSLELSGEMCILKFYFPCQVDTRLLSHFLSISVQMFLIS